MSLQVWLPMTKDLRQQGLSDLTFTNYGSTYLSTNGKLGGCYSFSGAGTAASNEIASTQKISISGDASYSIAFWFYWDGDSWSNDYVGVVGFGGQTTAGGAWGCLYNGRPDLDFWNCRYISPTQLSVKTWYHIAFTKQSGTGMSGHIYVNGVEVAGSSVNSYTPNIVSNRVIIGRLNSAMASRSFKGKINDVRIYDHCLSPMEVKRLSQGLVLHYPLNRGGWGQENLMPNSTIMSVGSANASTGSWRVAGSSQMTRSRVAISDSPIGDVYGCQSVGLQTGQDASCWGIDNFPRENGTTYTISAWGRIVGGSSTAAMLGFSVYSGTTLDYGGTYGQAKSSDTKYYGSGAYDYAGGQLNPNGSWTRIYRTFTSTSTSDNIYVGFNTAKTGNSVTLQLCGVKLEKGDKVTSWCPKNTDDLADVIGLNENIEYDCSGFCNNGTRTGTFTWTSDTPKYQISTKFNTNYIERDNLINNPSSTAFWIKFDSLSNQIVFVDYNTVASLGIYNNNLLIGYGADCKLTYPKTIINTDIWYHICIVKASNSAAQFYLNGNLQTPGSTSDYWTKVGTISQIGARSTNYYFKGNLSDFRIYATALSADDVRALYENSAYIASDGTSYAYEFVEE